MRMFQVGFGGTVLCIPDAWTVFVYAGMRYELQHNRFVQVGPA